MKKEKVAAKKAAIDITADAPINNEPPAGELTRCTKLAEEMSEIELRIGAFLDEIEILTKKHSTIEKETLPNLMNEIGMKEFKLKNGDRVFIKKVVRASLPSQSSLDKEKDTSIRAALKMRMEEGFAYLTKNQAGSLIKKIAKVDLPKDDDTIQKKVADAIKKLDLEVQFDKSVNANSLSAWVKERLEAGQDVDNDLLGVFNGEIAKIESPKQKKNQIS